MAEAVKLANVVAQLALNVTKAVTKYSNEQKAKEIICQKKLNNLLLEAKKDNVLQDIVMKQSKHFHHWNQRKIVLTQTMLGFFKMESLETTEWIKLSTINHCQCLGQKMFDHKKYFVVRFDGQDKHATKTTFKFACNSHQKQKEWIGWIKKGAHIKLKS